MAPPQNTKVNAKSKTFPEVKESKIPFQSGDFSFATEIRKQNNGSKTNASIIKTSAYQL